MVLSSKSTRSLVVVVGLMGEVFVCSRVGLVAEKESFLGTGCLLGRVLKMPLLVVKRRV